MEKDAVKFAINLRLRGLTYREIGLAMEVEGYRNKNGLNWGPQTVRNLLNRSRTPRNLKESNKMKKMMIRERARAELARNRLPAIAVSMRRAGERLDEIARFLNAEGERTLTKGRMWTVSSVGLEFRRLKVRPRSCRKSRPLPLRPGEIPPQIQNLRSDGLSFGAIADILQSDGVPTRRGGRWSAATVRNKLIKLERIGQGV